MFANDTSLNASDINTATIRNELQKIITEVSDCCDNNALILHPAKTESMQLATRQRHQLRPLVLNPNLKDNHIEQVHEHRHLGIIIDDEFSRRPHITSTCKTVSIYLHLLSQLKHFVDTSKQKLFHHAHISPHLTYASTVGDGCSDILLHKVNSLHRRAAKLMMPDLSLTTDAKLQHLRLLPLREKLMLNKAVLVFKACRNSAPQYLKDLFICHNIRAPSRSMILPKHRIDLFKTSFSFAGASHWNSITTRITSCSTLISFKTQLHKWLRNKM